MLKDVTIGQYYSGNSVVHRLDPRVKLRAVIIYIILLLMDRNLFQFLLLTIAFVGVIAMSKVPVTHVIKGSKGFFIFIIVVSCINIFTTSGQTLVVLGNLDITREGLIKTGYIIWRMFLMIMFSSLLMYTTTPTRITDGLEKGFHLSGKTAMSITIALRFIPVLCEEMNTIMKAQEARGARLKKGGVKKRIQNLKNVIFPLFRSAIRKSENLGDAMDARCYTGGKNRTKLSPLEYSMRDAVAYLITVTFAVVVIIMCVRY